MSYRLVDLEGHLSPCPCEIWYTRESAEQGLRFWERESGMKLKIVGENVRCAEQFVGRARHHASAFYLWGNAVPPLLPKGLIKMGNQGGYTKRGVFVHDPPGRRQPAAKSATIPPELANCVADYAERLLEQRAEQRPLHREAAK